MLFSFLLLVIFIACVALLFTEGMWSNAIRLINTITSALLAINFFEPVAAWLDGFQPSYTYFWDFIAIWMVFIVSMVLLSIATNSVSKVKVKFLGIVDRVGGTIFAMWIGWVVVCFAAVTFHTAPLARNFLGGGFQPEQRMLFGLAPDRQWLGFSQQMSLGTFSRSATPDESKTEKYVFDPRAEFMPKYATRRANLEKHMATTGGLSLRPGQQPH